MNISFNGKDVFRRTIGTLINAAREHKTQAPKYGEIITIEMGKPMIQGVAEVKDLHGSVNTTLSTAKTIRGI